MYIKKTNPKQPRFLPSTEKRERKKPIKQNHQGIQWCSFTDFYFHVSKESDFEIFHFSVYFIVKKKNNKKCKISELFNLETNSDVT